MLPLGQPLLAAEEVSEATQAKDRPVRLKSSSTFSSPSQVRRSKSRDLPDLRDRIEKLGLTEEYLAFKDRYLSWRQGSPTGARGEITVERITRPEHVAANRGFGHWYPTVQEWLWKRTMSYWIAVTFFEGSIFFAISSFMYNEQAALNTLYQPLTFYGYCAGKVFFFICTYFMCLECVNFRAQSDGAENSSDEGKLMSPELAPFYLWPFRSKTALRNLRSAGAGPWPWYTSASYFAGVLAFTVGLVAEVIPGSLGAFEVWLFNASFLTGGWLFLIGGLAECVQNDVLTSLDITKGWLGALLNLLGGLGFFTGAVMNLLEDERSSNDSYGWGAVLYAASSSIQIIMWKDEQFGLTFLSVINRLGPGPGSDAFPHTDHSRFSVWGVITVHACCICGALSTYNFNIKVMQMHTWRTFQYAFNELLPCLFAHMMLMLCSAVMRTPKVSPFRQLYLGVRVIILVLTVNSISTFVEFVSHSISG